MRSRKHPPKLRKYSNRSNWYIQDGRKVYSTGTAGEEEARCILAQYIADKEKPAEPDWNELLDRRAEDLIARKTVRGKDPEAFHKKLREHFGRLRPEHVTLVTINQFKAKREHVPAQLREELIEYNATLNMAIKNKWIKEGLNATLPKKAIGRQHYITRSQADHLLESTKSFHLQLFMLIATKTGHRKGAILDLTWDRVDFERKRLDFNNPDKVETNKRRTVVPVLGILWDWLLVAKDIARTNYVIEYNGKSVKDVKKSFERAVKRAGLPDWLTPHVLKHSVVSWLVEDGLSIDEIADLTATDRKTVLKIYRHFSPDYLQNTAVALAKNEETASMLVKQHQALPV